MLDEPHRRYGHVAVHLDHYILVFGGTLQDYEALGNDIIWMYNLYTGQWRKQKVPCKDKCPPACFGASATLIGIDIFMFGGRNIDSCKLTNTLWKLSRMPNGCFDWNEITISTTKWSHRVGSSDEIKQRKSKFPSPRTGHSDWEHGNKLWIFGGQGDSSDGYLTDHGYQTNDGENNQLLCFDPSCREWQNPKCNGYAPEARSGHTSAIIGHKAWLFGGYKVSYQHNFHDLYQLDMISLTWTEIKIDQNVIWPQGRAFCTLTAISEYQLVLNGGIHNHISARNTWIFDIASMSWSEYTVDSMDDKHMLWHHSCAPGINRGTAFIIGGELIVIDNQKIHYQEPQQHISILLEPKSLKHLAIQGIHENRYILPWQMMPKKFTCLLGFC